MSSAEGANPPSRALLVSVMVAVFLAAVDQTIVSTALPGITRELGNPALYAWVFTAYMVATTIFVPISGTIGDTHGRRSVMLFGVVMFALGSLLAGSAADMPQLIAYRVVQGIGAGVLTANAFALLGDLFSLQQMARATGMLSAVYGLAGAVGPLLGGLLTDHLGWRWIFWCNVPASAVIVAILYRQLPRIASARRDPVDIPGAVLLTATLLPALALLSWAGEGVSWRSPRMLLALALATVFAALFAMAERRAVRPIIALHLFGNTGFALAMLAMFNVALAMYAALSYAPLLFQQQLGMTASQSGVVTAPLVLVLAVTAAIAGRLMARGFSGRIIAALGIGLSGIALGAMSQLSLSAGQGSAAACMALLGAGLGFTMPTLLLVAQGSVSQAHIGVTAALAKFFRAVGGLVGVVAAGAVVRHYQLLQADSAAAISPMLLWAAIAMLATLGLMIALPATRPSPSEGDAHGEAAEKP